MNKLNHHTNHWGLHLGLMGTMLAWAVNISAVKWLTQTTPFWVVASVRMVFACFALLLIWRMMRQPLPQWSKNTLLLACASALLMVYGNQLLFVKAMEKTTASNASLILALNPIINGMLEASVFRKRLKKSYLVGSTLAICGVAIVILNQANLNLAGPSIGDLLVLASMVSFALGVLVLQYLARSNHPNTINVFVYVVGTLALLLQAWFSTPDPIRVLGTLTWSKWLVILFSGIGATALGAAAWGRAVSVMGLGRAAIYMSWVPVLGVASGAILLGETLTVWHAYGVILVLMGTGLSTLGFPPRLQRAK